MPLLLCHVLSVINSSSVQEDLSLLVPYNHIALKDVGTHNFTVVFDSLDQSPLL